MKVTALSCWHKGRSEFLDEFYVMVSDGVLYVFEDLLDMKDCVNEITADVDLILEKSALPSPRMQPPKT